MRTSLARSFFFAGSFFTVSQDAGQSGQTDTPEAVSTKDGFRLNVEMLRLRTSGFSPVAVAFEKTTDGTRRELKAQSRCREVDFLKNRFSQTVDVKSIAHEGHIFRS
jgi:hypothetical protein